MASRLPETPPLKSYQNGGKQRRGEDEGSKGRSKMKRAGKIIQPTKEEGEEHGATHTHTHTHAPYRSWCRRCVRGRAREDAHGRVDESERVRSVK